MMVMVFGAACSPTSAQYVKNLNATEYEGEYPEAAEAIRKLHYVDDFVASFATESDAVRITRDVLDIHRRGGFELRRFVSNSQRVLSALGAAENGDPAIDMHLDKGAGEKILGLRWRTQSDTFEFELRFHSYAAGWRTRANQTRGAVGGDEYIRSVWFPVGCDVASKNPDAGAVAIGCRMGCCGARDD